MLELRYGECKDKRKRKKNVEGRVKKKKIEGSPIKKKDEGKVWCNFPQIGIILKGLYRYR